jgi:hypothetical protein
MTGGDPVLAGTLGAVFPAKFNGKIKSADQKIAAVVKKGITKGARPYVTGKPSASKMQNYYDKTADGVKAIVANKSGLQFVDDATGEITSRLPQSVAEYAQAIEQTKNKVFNLYNDLAIKAGDKGATFNARPIVSKLKTLRPILNIILTQDNTLQNLSPRLKSCTDKIP